MVWGEGARRGGAKGEAGRRKAGTIALDLNSSCSPCRVSSSSRCASPRLSPLSEQPQLPVYQSSCFQPLPPPTSISTASTSVIFTQHKSASVSPQIMGLQWLPVVFKIILWSLFTSPPLSLPIASTLRALEFLRAQTKAHLLISFLGPLRGTPFPILSLAALFRISHLSTLPVSSSQFSLTLQAVSVTSSGLSHPLQFLHPSLMTVWVFPIIALSTLRRHYLASSPSPTLDCDLSASQPGAKHPSSPALPSTGGGGEGGHRIGAPHR